MQCTQRNGGQCGGALPGEPGLEPDDPGGALGELGFVPLLGGVSGMPGVVPGGVIGEPGFVPGGVAGEPGFARRARLSGRRAGVSAG